MRSPPKLRSFSITMNTTVKAAFAAALLAGSASAQVTFTQLATVNIASTSNIANPEYIGANASGVAWDGSRLFLAGFNNTGAAADVAIVEVLNPLSGTPTYNKFGVQAATPAQRGYSGLDIEGNTLFAAYDRGVSDPNGITAYSLAGTSLWAQAGRGGSGVGRDPGFGGVDFGAGWTSFGSGRRALNDEVSGAVLYSGTTGTIINGSGTGTFWRDMDFDAATGDIWLREGNNLIRAPRTGGNTTATALLVVDEVEADSVAGQNVAYMSSNYGDLVIYNDRPNTSGGQDFLALIKAVTPAGAPQTINWGSFLPINYPLGAGWYDFSWHEATNTLALLDFTQRAVYIFRREPPAPTNYCTAGTSTNGCVATMSSVGAPSVSQATPFSINTTNVEGAKQGILFYGTDPVALPWASGSTSFICVKSPTQRAGSQTSGGTVNTCNGAFTLDWNAWMSANPSLPFIAGDAYYIQSWYRDPPAVKTTNLSDGLVFYLAP